MPFVIFLLAYLVRRNLDHGAHREGDGLWRSLFRRGSSVEAGKEARIWVGLLIVGIPGLFMFLVDLLAAGWIWRVLGYPLEFLLLLVLMGIPGWRERLEAYIASWENGDMQGAWHHVRDILPAEECREAKSSEEMHLLLSRHFMMAVFERYFLVAFWYVVGGIGLAFLARGLVGLRDHWPQAAARTRYRALVEIVGWLPARVLACTFGLAGDLAGWLRDGRKGIFSLHTQDDELLMKAANSALTGYALDPARFSEVHPDESARFGGFSLAAVRDLFARSMLVWICGIAVLVISGVV